MAEIHNSTTGKIYKCLNRRTGILVAIKIFEIFNEEELNDINNEYKEDLSASKEITNSTVKIIEYFIFCGRLFLVMEYFENGSLMDLIIKLKKVDYKYVPFIIKELLLSLNKLHKMNICHKNIKPSKIYITINGEIKLKLSEICPKMHEIIAKNKTVLTMNFNYTCPEYIKKGIYNLYSDIWGVGIILYVLLKGKTPFEKFNKTKTLFEIANKPVTLPKAEKYTKYYYKILHRFYGNMLKQQF